jgi:hypothetical protein
MKRFPSSGQEGSMTFARLIFLTGLLCAAGTAAAQTAEKVEINIFNNRREAITMRFDYAFRDYTWNLIQANVDADDDVT